MGRKKEIKSQQLTRAYLTIQKSFNRVRRRFGDLEISHLLNVSSQATSSTQQDGIVCLRSNLFSLSTAENTRVHFEYPPGRGSFAKRLFMSFLLTSFHQHIFFYFFISFARLRPRFLPPEDFPPKWKLSFQVGTRKRKSRLLPPSLTDDRGRTWIPAFHQVATTALAYIHVHDALTANRQQRVSNSVKDEAILFAYSYCVPFLYL